jgi:hypothetical protein
MCCTCFLHYFVVFELAFGADYYLECPAKALCIGFASCLIIDLELFVRDFESKSVFALL